MRLPLSLLFFVLTGLVFVAQMIPFIGIFLMFALAMFWSVVLVNLGMVGVALEALVGRVSRLWLLLPLAFYGGYYAIAAQDHATLAALSARYAAANEAVRVPFDPASQALVFAGEDNPAAWLTQNYALPVAYTVNTNFPEGHLSHRLMASDVCAEVRASPATGQAFVHAFGFHDGDAIRSRRMDNRFCALSMPERPEQLVVRVARREADTGEGMLPVSRRTTTITLPDGRTYTLQGGFAAPLSWLPMPIMGCALNSGAPSWDCDAGFWRNGFTPIVPGGGRYGRDNVVLAEAIGLRRVAIADRVGADPARVRAKIAAVEQATLARQLAAVDAMIADPLAEVKDWQTGVLANRPEALASRADAIMTGIERAAAAGMDPQDRYRARESGRILARLLTSLPRDRFVAYGPRVLPLYAAADDGHWLWEAETLLRRLGDLGVGAAPYLIRRRALGGNVNNAGIEGLCRIGPPARAIAAPVLHEKWRTLQSGDRDLARDLVVAMRRIGISVPPPVEDKRGRIAAVVAEWADVTPASPPRVCATRAEDQARREEKYSGKRRTNLD